MITIPAYLYGSFIRRIEHLGDAVIELESFAGKNPTTSFLSLFWFIRLELKLIKVNDHGKGSSGTVNSVYSSEYHGLFHVHKLPTINSLIPSSIKLSILAGSGVGNNLGFKLRRKKFSIETFHLPPEGGISERRTDSKEKKSDEKRNILKSSEKIGCGTGKSDPYEF